MTLRTRLIQHSRRLGLACLLGCLATAPCALASNKFLEIPPEQEATSSRAYHYANLTNEETLAELDRRQIPYERIDPVPGVRLPIRLTGRLRGVWIHSVLPPEQRKTTPFEILDGRLALALDDFCGILAAHGFVEVVHFTMYRPPHDGPADETKEHHR
ncbi:MAG TPA: hypothetical protein VLC09_12800, partial [Polyangiaceae bacterium]|nr:hypothetical protein [Polyangiaceae bacterium]